MIALFCYGTWAFQLAKNENRENRSICPVFALVDWAMMFLPLCSCVRVVFGTTTTSDDRSLYGQKIIVYFILWHTRKLIDQKPKKRICNRKLKTKKNIVCEERHTSDNCFLKVDKDCIECVCVSLSCFVSSCDLCMCHSSGEINFTN